MNKNAALRILPGIAGLVLLLAWADSELSTFNPCTRFEAIAQDMSASGRIRTALNVYLDDDGVQEYLRSRSERYRFSSGVLPEPLPALPVLLEFGFHEESNWHLYYASETDGDANELIHQGTIGVSYLRTLLLYSVDEEKGTISVAASEPRVVCRLRDESI